METRKTEQQQRASEDERRNTPDAASASADTSSSPTTKKVATATKKGTVKKKPRVSKNNVRKLRTERMMSKAELARRAGLSTLTIDRVEKGMPCRMDTKRKILEALGLTPSDRVAVFGEED